MICHKNFNKKTHTGKTQFFSEALSLINRDYHYHYIHSHRCVYYSSRYETVAGLMIYSVLWRKPRAKEPLRCFASFLLFSFTIRLKLFLITSEQPLNRKSDPKVNMVLYRPIAGSFSHSSTVDIITFIFYRCPKWYGFTACVCMNKSQKCEAETKEQDELKDKAYFIWKLESVLFLLNILSLHWFEWWSSAKISLVYMQISRGSQ